MALKKETGYRYERHAPERNGNQRLRDPDDQGYL